MTTRQFNIGLIIFTLLIIIAIIHQKIETIKSNIVFQFNLKSDFQSANLTTFSLSSFINSSTSIDTTFNVHIINNNSFDINVENATFKIYDASNMNLFLQSKSSQSFTLYANTNNTISINAQLMLSIKTIDAITSIKQGNAFKIFYDVSMNVFKYKINIQDTYTTN